MAHAPVVPDSIADRADALPLAFVCSWTNGGLDAAWVHELRDQRVVAG